jgi:CRP/FNR family cyclic AMP-dependent transcriptional regulator
MPTEIVMVDPAALQKYSLFGGLLVEQISLIRPLFGQEGYAAGEAIIKEGDANDRIRFVMEGKVSVSRRGVPLTELGEGEFFGEMEVLDVMPSAATCRATAPTLVATISNKALREMYKLDARVFSLIIMNLARDLSRRLRPAPSRPPPLPSARRFPSRPFGSVSPHTKKAALEERRARGRPGFPGIVRRSTT